MARSLVHGSSARVPRRILVVSADIGGGHDATGRALLEVAGRIWPGSAVHWTDTLEAMGPGVGRAFRRTYVTNVEHTPWLYEFFYASLWRHRWFAASSKRFVGGWAGRRLSAVVERFDPDLILSMYPLGTAGLAWLRRRYSLAAPVGAWISDFAPHPFWVYPEADVNLVVHPAAVATALAAAPGSRVAVCPPPVSVRFRPGDPLAARRSTGLPLDRFIALVTSGSYGFGPMDEAVRALLRAGGAVHVVAVCGRSRELARRLGELGGELAGRERLRVLGWVDDMPSLLRAADVVVTNAGGATALEAVATGRPVVMYRPIAAHGAANAALLSTAGLAEVCRTPEQLTALVRTMAGRGGRRHALARVPEATGERPAEGLAEGLRALGEVPGAAGAGRRGSRPLRPASWPLRPADAFFWHVQTPSVAQQVGAVLTLGPVPGRGPVRAADVAELIERRLPALVTLRRRVVPRGRWRRPGWTVDPEVDLAAQVTEHSLADPADQAEAARVVDGFWSRPLPAGRPLWQVLVVSGLPGGQSVLAVKLHHALCDGLSAIGTLRRLLDIDGVGPVHSVTGGGAGSAPPPKGSQAARRGWGARAARRAARAAGHAGILARGLTRLAVAGFAPRLALNRPLGPDRRFVGADLDTATLTRLARAYGVAESEVSLAVIAEAMHRVLVPPGCTGVRAMFPVSLSPRVRASTHGNWTGAVNLDLPVGPVPPGARVREIHRKLRGSLAGGEPAAAALVMRAMGRLPAPVHAGLARRVYHSRFFNVIVSHVRGPVRPGSIAGAPVVAAYPVVGLAGGVPVGVGVLRWASRTGVGVLLEGSLAGRADDFAAALHEAVGALAGEAGLPALSGEAGPSAGSPAESSAGSPA